MNRLFVPLNKDPFTWFASGEKRWELRKDAGRFKSALVRPGRRVELRSGYGFSQVPLWGQIIEVVQAETLREFFERVPYFLVIPVAKTLNDAVTEASRILSVSPDEPIGLVGFEVELDE